MQIRGQHKRTAPDSQPRRFGFCETHPKRYNEYYDRTRNQSYCTECAIEMTQGKKDGQSNLVLLKNAFSLAKQRAMNTDAAMEQRKHLIKN